MSDEAAVRDAFAQQARWCRELGSPFTALLCATVAQRLDRTTAMGARVLDWSERADPGRDVLPLRLAGGLHALVRRGRLPALAALYPPPSCHRPTRQGSRVQLAPAWPAAARRRGACPAPARGRPRAAGRHRPGRARAAAGLCLGRPDRAAGAARDGARHRRRRPAHAAAIGARASASGPFAWLSYEIEPALQDQTVLRLRSWPGGEDRVLATGDPHARALVWLGG